MHVDEAGHTPLGQLLIEGTGLIEHHVVHVGDAGHIPRRQFIIEQIGIRKHVVHVDGAVRVRWALMLSTTDFGTRDYYYYSWDINDIPL